MESRYWIKHTVLKLICGCDCSFWWSQQRKPCSESFKETYLNGVKILNKMYSFEISIRLWPPFQLSLQNKTCSTSLKDIHLNGVKILNKTYSFEVSIRLWPLISIVLTKWALFWKFQRNSSKWSQDIDQYV